MTDKECLCLQILQACRVELCDLFPYLDSAFASLGWRFSREPGYRVDGNHLECSVPDLLTLYGQNPAAVRRGYLHALLHCLFVLFRFGAAAPVQPQPGSSAAGIPAYAAALPVRPSFS